MDFRFRSHPPRPQGGAGETLEKSTGVDLE